MGKSNEEHALRPDTISSYVIDVPTPLLVVTGILSVLITTVNSLAIVAFIRTRRLKNVTSYYMISLAVADLGVGLTLGCLFIYTLVCDMMGERDCDILGYLFSVSWLISINSITLLSIERYVAIVNPFRHHILCRKSVALVTIIVAWVGSCLMWTLPLAGFGGFAFNTIEGSCYFNVIKYPIKWTLDTVTIFFGPTLVIGACYYRIWSISSYHGRQLRELRKASRQSLSSSGCRETLASPGLHYRPRFLPRRISNNTKALRTVLLIVCVFYVAWTPFVAEKIHAAVRGQEFYDGRSQWAAILIYCLAVSNSLWNPIIYITTNKLFRKASLALLMSPKCCPGSWRRRVCTPSRSTAFYTYRSRRVSVVSSP